MTTMDNQNQPTMETYLNQMKLKAEELLNKFFVGKTFSGKPWVEEMTEVTGQLIVDITVTNTDLSHFNIQTSVQDHMLFMNVQDNQGNTISDVIYLVTYAAAGDDNGYTVDEVQVEFKCGAFLAPKAATEEKEDRLPF